MDYSSRREGGDLGCKEGLMRGRWARSGAEGWGLERQDGDGLEVNERSGIEVMDRSNR